MGFNWPIFRRPGSASRRAYDLILREAMTSDDRDPAGVYFGTTGGTLFHTRDSGDSWHVLSAHLPPIYSVTGAFY